jgi:hypothetical protein
MKRFTRLALSLIVYTLLSISNLQAKVMDRTAATVNGEAIFLSELEKNATPPCCSWPEASS